MQKPLERARKKNQELNKNLSGLQSDIKILGGKIRNRKGRVDSQLADRILSLQNKVDQLQKKLESEMRSLALAKEQSSLDLLEQETLHFLKKNEMKDKIWQSTES